jgi:hypothetical protein
VRGAVIGTSYGNQKLFPQVLILNKRKTIGGQNENLQKSGTSPERLVPLAIVLDRRV